jgi:chromosomal replication initiator protein
MPEKSYTEIWNNCLNIIRDNVTPQNYKTWFKPINAVAIEEKVLTIQVPVLKMILLTLLEIKLV